MLATSLRRFAAIGLAAFALTTSACGDDSSGSTGPAPVPADVSGTYALTGLRTLGNLNGGGNGLPVTFTDGGGSTLRFLGGELVLTADGSYSLEVDAEFNGGGVTMSDEGSYQIEGAAIDFDPTTSQQRMDSGTINGSSIRARVQFGGIPFEIDLQK